MTPRLEQSLSRRAMVGKVRCSPASPSSPAATTSTPGRDGKAGTSIEQESGDFLSGGD
jgi:hypothetical protein